MSSGPSQRSDARRNRDLILDAAARVLGRDADASLLDVATEAGLSRATVYRHFSTMEAVERALLDEVEEMGRGVLKDGLIDAVHGDARHDTVSEQMLRMLAGAIPIETRYSETMASARNPEETFLTTFGPVMRATVVEGQRRGEYSAGLDPGANGDALITLMILAGRRFHRDGVAIEDAIEPVRTFLRGMEVGKGR